MLKLLLMFAMSNNILLNVANPSQTGKTIPLVGVTTGESPQLFISDANIVRHENPTSFYLFMSNNKNSKRSPNNSKASVRYCTPNVPEAISLCELCNEISSAALAPLSDHHKTMAAAFDMLSKSPHHLAPDAIKTQAFVSHLLIVAARYGPTADSVHKQLADKVHMLT